MNNHKGKRLYITGIPAAGKSYLARKLAQDVGGIAVSLDHHREVLGKDAKYKEWIEFYLNKDEKQYYSETSPEEQWNNLVEQSKVLWPGFLEKISSYKDEEKPVIFECVNLLPSIVSRDINFSGMVVIGNSYEEILERNIKDPRWGKTKDLQEMEAKAFFFVERPNYIREAEEHGVPIFLSADAAYETALGIINNNAQNSS